MGKDLSILYVSDIHGSDRCFRKFLNAGPHYGVDLLVIGGDLTGKIIVPVYRTATGRTAHWDGADVELSTDGEFDAFSKKLREGGCYAFETTPDEVEAIRASVELEREVFNRHKARQLEEWIALADERLGRTGARAMVMPGNDDPASLDPILETGTYIANVGDRVVELRDGIYMASVGESTPTPWHTPRELSDEALGEKLAETVAGLPADGYHVWNFHMPPYDTGVDVVPRLDDQLRVQYKAGQPDMIPVGCRSLRDLIAARQPQLALHGHIHEGRGRYTIGRTVGFNPGSQYQDGILLGIILTISAQKGLRSYSFVAG